jgi:hypothetical protein
MGTGHRVKNEEEALTRAREYFERFVEAGGQSETKFVDGLEDLVL